jgi:hypothetical protein
MIIPGRPTKVTTSVAITNEPELSFEAYARCSQSHGEKTELYYQLQKYVYTMVVSANRVTDRSL